MVPRRRGAEPLGMSRRTRWLAVAALVGACGGDARREPDATTTTTRAPAVAAPTPAGDFAVLAGGNASGLRWTLSRAPASDDGTCWRIETDPPVDLLLGSTECRPRPDPAQPRDFGTEFPFGTGATGEYDIVVGVVPGGVAGAEFAFVDGTTEPARFLDREQGIVVWAGTSRPFLAAVTLTTSDGERLGCGPGDVMRASQLVGKTDQELLDARRYVWTCMRLD
jgi:hypothetical protein